MAALTIDEEFLAVVRKFVADIEGAGAYAGSQGDELCVALCVDLVSALSPEGEQKKSGARMGPPAPKKAKKEAELSRTPPRTGMSYTLITSSKQPHFVSFPYARESLQ